MHECLEVALKNLAAHGFEAVAADTLAAARESVLGIIPPGSTVGFGDSATLHQLGLREVLAELGCINVDLYSPRVSLLTMAGRIPTERRRRVATLAMQCEFFVSSTNAVTQSGALVNVDGYANRVAAMACGPQRVIVVAGRNKIVSDVDSALARIRGTIAPTHASTMGMNTPCAVTGYCSDCDSPERICGTTVIMERAPRYLEGFHVVLVDEDLGLSWDEDWCADRIARIRSWYEAQTFLRLGSRSREGY